VAVLLIFFAARRAGSQQFRLIFLIPLTTCFSCLKKISGIGPWADVLLSKAKARQAKSAISCEKRKSR
jgi:hypothetical protein